MKVNFSYFVSLCLLCLFLVGCKKSFIRNIAHQVEKDGRIKRMSEEIIEDLTGVHVDLNTNDLVEKIIDEIAESKEEVEDFIEEKIKH